MSVDLAQLSPWAQRQILEKLRQKEAEKQRRCEQDGGVGGRISPFGRNDTGGDGIGLPRRCAPRNDKGNKYHAQKDRRGGIRFDSKKEARRYDELVLLLKSGEISDLRLQPQYTLQESYVTPEGTRVRAIRYVADFSYKRQRPDGTTETVVEDVKSNATKTRQYQMKRKLLRTVHGITITEV